MKRWGLAGQLALAGLLLWLIGRAVATRWEEFRAADLQVSLALPWLVLSAVLTVVTFAVLIQSWRVVLAGWQQHLAGRELAEIWFVANLGRYVPGKIWSVAGLIVLATRKGVEGWAASAGAVVVQALGLVTAVAVAVATLPGVAAGFRLAAAGATAGGVVALLSSSRVTRFLAARVPRLAELRPVPPLVLAAAAGFALLGWAGYGAALWALASGLGFRGMLPIGLATGAFALAYTAGLLALFAPGGILVREGVLVALLSPSLGAGPALAIGLGSRLILTLVELVVALPFVVTWTRSTPRAAG